MRLDGRAEAEGHAERRRHLGQAVRELEAVAGLVAGQAQRTDELLLRERQRRLGPDEAVAVEHLVRHAVLLQHLDVVADAVELLLRAEQLQRALRALVVGDAGLGAQRLQAVAAVFGDRHHAALVDA